MSAINAVVLLLTVEALKKKKSGIIVSSRQHPCAAFIRNVSPWSVDLQLFFKLYYYFYSVALSD